MFTNVESPTGHFTLLRFPDTFHELPNPFGVGGLLILNKFANNSAKLQSEHLAASRSPRLRHSRRSAPARAPSSVTASRIGRVRRR